MYQIALDLFAEKGIEGTSIRDIVGRAGISTAAFYNHFESKDALLRAVYDHHRQARAAAAPLSAEEGARLLEELGPVEYYMHCMELFRLAMENPVLEKLGRIISTENGRNATAAEISHNDCEKLIESTEEMFEAMQGLGFLKGRNARLLGRMTGYMQLGLFGENIYYRYTKKEGMDEIMARQNKQLRRFLEELIGG